MSEWYDEFFEGIYGRVLAQCFEEAQTLEHVRVVKKLLKLRRGQRVLDIPCGQGRLTLPLARMGLHMSGVDLTAKFLRRARQQARQENLDIRFVRSDMREIEFEDEFHAAFNWFGSFGYFSDEGNLELCRRVLRALKPGGRFLVEGINKSALLTNFRPHGEDLIGGVRVVRHNRWNARTGRVASTWTMSRGKATEQHTVSMRIFNGAEMRSLLRAAGFESIRLSGHPPLGRFTRHSRRLIAVAQKG